MFAILSLQMMFAFVMVFASDFKTALPTFFFGFIFAHNWFSFPHIVRGQAVVDRPPTRND